MTTTINIQNHSTLISDTDVDLWVRSIKADLSTTLMPAWGLRAAHITIDTPTVTGWPIVILDDADQAGALGYHATDPRGKPYGRVFARPTIQARLSIASVLDHEIKEALGDPGANRWADLPDHRSSIALELCDPVQGNTYTTPDGVEHSDFVLPAYFDPGAPGPYSYLDSITDPNRPHLPAPFTCARGGYRILRAEGGRITTPTGAQYPSDRAPHIGEAGSRTALRGGAHRARPITASIKYDRAHQWRYSVDHGNHEKVDPSESYTRRSSALRAIQTNRPEVTVVKVYSRTGRLVRTVEISG